MNDHSAHHTAQAGEERAHELDRAAEHAGHGRGHEHLGHAGHADVYRRRFWITLILAVPVVLDSEMIQDWFGFTAPEFPADGLVGPVLGTVIFFYGGSVFPDRAAGSSRAKRFRRARRLRSRSRTP